MIDAHKWCRGEIRMKMIAKSAGLALLLSSSVWAEIYETTDSEGNKVFTDTPTEQAEVVELPDANIADSVEPRPRPQAEAAPAARPAAPGQPTRDDDDEVYIIGDTHNERLEEKIVRERRQEVLEGEKPHEVLDAETRHESREAEVIRHKEGAVEAAPHRAVHPVRHHR
jgi:hypothetical protein